MYQRNKKRKESTNQKKTFSNKNYTLYTMRILYSAEHGDGYLTAESIDEAVFDYVDGLDAEVIRELDKVEIVEYHEAVLEENFVDNYLHHLYNLKDDVDESYQHPEHYDYRNIDEEVVNAFKEFLEVFKSYYTPTLFNEYTTHSVVLKDWLKEHNNMWSDNPYEKVYDTNN